ncbi:transglycosylase SLT domain-containing protein [Undibacterium sp. Di27W]|uniref:transglycosylase SLT domain-containing protein n=1 Tax=Undibacterium sp. Di27W TaxID=3413036 RepID=UPI003BF3E17D
MRHFLPAFSIPTLFAYVMLACIWCTSSVQAQEIPKAAHQYRNDLTRIARSVWGLDAPVPVFAAQIHQESGWNPGAVSKVGALGMTQFMPATAKWWCSLNSISAADCQPRNPIWSMRSLVGYDYWLYQRVYGDTEFDRLWAMKRSYNGGLGHWQKEASLVWPARDHDTIDAACGLASRARIHCAENLGYPDRILNSFQYRYSAWGRTVGQP